MTVYYSANPITIGGMKKRPVFRVSADSWEELLSFSKVWSERCVLVCPPRGKNSHKSRARPAVYLDQDCESKAVGQGMIKVSDLHIQVLTWVLRKEIYYSRQEITPEIEKFFEVSLRGAMVRLLRAGEWIERPEIPELVILNVKLEKIDLGRRSDLKYSRYQDTTKYDQDMRKDRLEELNNEPGPDDAYVQADSAGRAKLRGMKPWMASKWIDLYGE